MKRLVSLILAITFLITAAITVTPASAETLSNTNTVSSGNDYSAVIKTDGSLWTWGNNGYGQLGNGTADKSLVPVKITDDAASVSLGQLHSAAIKKDGSLWIWGYGKFGDEYTNLSYTPAKFMEDVAAVSLGSLHNIVIKSDGSLWAWGDNFSGQLGDGTYSYSYAPIKIMDNVASVGLGDMHSAAIKNDGSLWMWGNNELGQLGNGTTEDSQSPIKIMDDAASVSLGQLHSAVIKTDGSLWAWGNNGYGQLGNRTADKSLVPVKITDDIKLPDTIKTEPISAAPSAWAEYDINQAISQGLVPEELQYYYQEAVTRLDFCKLVLSLYKKINGDISPIYLSGLKDTKSLTIDDQYIIGAAYTLGIINGYEDKTFRPYNQISRQEAAAILMRAAKVLGLSDPANNESVTYKDCSDIEDWAKEAVEFVCNSGIMSEAAIRTESENSDSSHTYITFSPHDSCTREQAAVTHYRLYNIITE